MALLDRLRSSALSASELARRQASRVVLELQASRVENDIRKQKTRIGEVLYPLIAKNELEITNSEAERAVKRIDVLMKKLSLIEHDIEELIEKRN
jgi:hypothetical protein